MCTLKSTNKFKKCDDVSSELRALLKEKRELDLQVAALERKESKSKWYKKKKKTSSESKTKKVASTPESSIKILDFLWPENDASPPTANSHESLPDTVILDDNELPPVLPDDFHPAADDPGLNSQNLEDSQRLQDPPLR